MLSYNDLRDQTLIFRQSIVGILKALKGREEDIPKGWNNNALWHAGHLVVTPQLIAHGLAGEELRVPAEYRNWFAKGTSPLNWDDAKLPAYDQLIGEIEEKSAEIFTSIKGREDEAYPQAYTTTPGVILKTRAEGLNFSLVHDGIHLGLLLALKRSL